jgi:hypothetical protein
MKSLAGPPAGLFHLLLSHAGLRMNIVQRRQLIKGHVIDAAVAKTAVSRSKRQRADAARTLRKAFAASRAAAIKLDTIAYPH